MKIYTIVYIYKYTKTGRKMKWKECRMYQRKRRLFRGDLALRGYTPNVIKTNLFPKTLKKKIIIKKIQTFRWTKKKNRIEKLPYKGCVWKRFLYNAGYVNRLWAHLTHNENPNDNGNLLRNAALINIYSVQLVIYEYNKTKKSRG